MSISWQSIFSVPSRVFGCTCFVQDLSLGLDKLSPRFIKYVFAGYSRTQKEYRCYNPSTRKYFVSVDVIFFESVPYFSPQGPVTTSEYISLLSFVPLPVPAAVHDVSSPVSLKDTTAPPAPKPQKRFQTCLHSSAKNSCLWIGSDRFLSSGRSTSLAVITFL